MRSVFLGTGQILGSLALVLVLSGCASKGPQMAPAEPVMPTKSIVNAGVTAKIVKYGLYKSRGPVWKRFDSNVPNQTSSVSMESTFQEQTDRIPGRLGTQFGVWFEISGLPRQTVAELQTVVFHPPIKGANGQETTRSFWVTLAPVNKDGVGRGTSGYIIEEPYEIANGEWTIEIKRAGEVLLRQKFYMYRVRK